MIVGGEDSYLHAVPAGNLLAGLRRVTVYETTVYETTF